MSVTPPNEVNSAADLVIAVVSDDKLDDRIPYLIINVRHHAPEICADRLGVCVHEQWILEEDRDTGGRLVKLQRTEAKSHPAQLLLGNSAGDEIYRFVDAHLASWTCHVVNFCVYDMLERLVAGEYLALVNILSQANPLQVSTDTVGKRVGIRLRVNYHPNVVYPPARRHIVKKPVHRNQTDSAEHGRRVRSDRGTASRTGQAVERPKEAIDDFDSKAGDSERIHGGAGDRCLPSSSAC